MRNDRRITLLTWLVLAIGLLATTGCSAVRGELVETGVGTADAALDASPFSTDEVENESDDLSEAFNFSGTELFRRSTVSGADLYNNAPMIVTFVTPTCAICRSEGPQVAAAAETYGDITYVIVHSGDTTKGYESYADDNGLFQENVIHLDDGDGVLLRRFSVTSYPTSLLVGADGAVRQSVGALESQGLDEAAKVVLGSRT